MTRKILYFLTVLLVMMGLLLMVTITPVPRTPIHEMAIYGQMKPRLDSLEEALVSEPEAPTILKIGWSAVNITPEFTAPLAGYGGRKPKSMNGVRDSTYIRAVVFQNTSQKAALITADLLIIHPEITRKVWELLAPDWTPGELYFTATHTHSGEGGWAPGTIGKLFAGEYDPETVERLAQRMADAVRSAEQAMSPGSLSFMEFNVPDLVKNRIVGSDGVIDPWFKVIRLQKDSNTGYFTFFAAHATCYGQSFQKLSSDYPGKLVEQLERDSTIHFAAFGAGAMGSMTHGSQLPDEQQEVLQMASTLSQQVHFLELIGTDDLTPAPLRSYQLSVPLRDPYFKLTKNLALRPYLFRMIVEEYPVHIRVLQFGSLLLVGLPCDFSGELAPALYAYARQKNLNLVISSFNGEYIGYVVKDEWYDLDTYESRTMSWYGPDTGSYFSEIIKRIIDASSNY